MRSVRSAAAALAFRLALFGTMGCALGVIGYSGPLLRAQQPGTASGPGAAAPVAFDAASIRRNKDAEEARALAVAAAPGVARAPGRARTAPGGMLIGQAMTTRELIRDAFGYRNRALSDVTGGPSWLDEERYNVMAKAAIDFPTSSMAGIPPEAERLLRQLLEDRFKLKVRTETRKRPVYELMLAQDGKLGDGLRPSDGKCASFYGFSTSLTAADPAGAPADRKPACPFTLSGGVFSAGNMTMKELTLFLPAFPSINTVVIDKTGLKGGYDVTVKYQLADINAANSPEMASRPLFNKAFEQQTGIKLVKTEGPVEVLVIERVEHPTEN